MRRWDRFLDSYMEQYRARGICEATVQHTRAKLEQWGGWMKQRRRRIHFDALAPLLAARDHSDLGVWGAMEQKIQFRALCWMAVPYA